MAEKGSLVVFVTTARMAIPVRDARVSVYDPETRQLLGFRTTNNEGLTEIFELETPDITLSQSPQNGEESPATPFRVCNVQVNHPQYYSVLIEDVQIFSNRKSIQNVELIPIEEFGTAKNNSSEFLVTPQNL